MRLPMDGETVALDLAIEEFRVDPSSADKLRNLSRGLTRFRTKRESKGIHGRSFQGAYSLFAEVGREDLDTCGFLSLSSLCLDELPQAATPRSSTLHSPKTLLQHHFRFDEYAMHEDESMGSIKPGKNILGATARPLTVLVDELWGLCLDERTIITSSRASAHDLWPSIASPRSIALKAPANQPTEHLPPSLINALKDYFGDSLVIHPASGNKRTDTTSSSRSRFEYELNTSNHVLPLNTSHSTKTPWRLWRKSEETPPLTLLQLRDLNLLLSYVASPTCLAWHSGCVNVSNDNNPFDWRGGHPIPRISSRSNNTPIHGIRLHTINLKPL
ncbi:MAG: hypothetical protein Q9226_003709 [Calogaya cf. arnoldii]